MLISTLLLEDIGVVSNYLSEEFHTIPYAPRLRLVSKIVYGIKQSAIRKKITIEDKIIAFIAITGSNVISYYMAPAYRTAKYNLYLMNILLESIPGDTATFLPATSDMCLPGVCKDGEVDLKAIRERMRKWVAVKPL